MGIVKGLLKAKLYVLSFVAGAITYRCVSADEHYAVTRVDSRPYLVDRVSNEKLRIHETTFQAGSIKHRIRGLLAEPGLQEILEELTKAAEEGK